jgi:hypothetical protein
MTLREKKGGFCFGLQEFTVCPLRISDTHNSLNISRVFLQSCFYILEGKPVIYDLLSIPAVSWPILPRAPVPEGNKGISVTQWFLQK